MCAGTKLSLAKPSLLCISALSLISSQHYKVFIVANTSWINSKSMKVCFWDGLLQQVHKEALNYCSHMWHRNSAFVITVLCTWCYQKQDRCVLNTGLTSVFACISRYILLNQFNDHNIILSINYMPMMTKLKWNQFQFWKKNRCWTRGLEISTRLKNRSYIVLSFCNLFWNWPRMKWSKNASLYTMVTTIKQQNLIVLFSLQS